MTPRPDLGPDHDEVSFGEPDERSRLGRWLDDRATRDHTRLVRSRGVLLGLVVANVVVLAVAAVGWQTRGREVAPEPTAYEGHGLSEAAAFCLAFARIENRVTVQIGGPLPIGVGPVAAALSHEVRLLLQLENAYPGVDEALLVAVDDLVYSSVDFLGTGRSVGTDDEGLRRYDALVQVRDLCRTVGDFDVMTSEPRK